MTAGLGRRRNWNGAAFDPETGMLYVPSVTFPWLGALVPGTGRFTYQQTRKRLDREPGPGPRGPADHQAALRPHHRHRPEHAASTCGWRRTATARAIIRC